MDYIQYFEKQVSDSISTKSKLLESAEIREEVAKIITACVQAYKKGKKLIFAGNGGSAADSQHLAGELISRFYYDRPGLAALALNTDTSTITAIGNDYSYDYIFARQIEANGQSGDVFFAISTSGNSKNILSAIEVCKARKITVVGLTGQSGGKMKGLCDFHLRVPSTETPRIQESHILLGHIICAAVEAELFPKT